MKTFLKANIASLTASFCDYLVTFVLKQFLHFDPVYASITGTVIGGIINFWICRQWVFEAAGAGAVQQGKRYLITWTGNLLLNSLGVFLLIRFAGMFYLLAKLLTSLTVAVAYNYPLQKNYVFKNINNETQ
ncbi:MAG: GtrA family protein [Bacteroidota bacterium]|nr:GtrA family protein [Ferruginibacter sp.]